MILIWPFFSLIDTGESSKEGISWFLGYFCDFELRLVNERFDSFLGVLFVLRLFHLFIMLFYYPFMLFYLSFDNIWTLYVG